MKNALLLMIAFLLAVLLVLNIVSAAELDLLAKT